MIRAEVPIVVIEGDDPLVTLQVYATTEGVTSPYDFTGATAVEFIVKPSITSEEVLATYGMGTGVNLGDPLTSGRLTVQVEAADIGPVANKRYKLRVQRGGLWETVMAGQFIIKNV